MASSLRFRELRKRHAALRRNLLPKLFSLTGDYSSRQVDRVRGYRLLAHAEMEAYLEDRATLAVRSEIDKWKKGGEPSRILFALVACYQSGWGDVSTQEDNPQSKKLKNLKLSVEELIDEANTQYHSRISNNNGINEQSLRNVLSPLGIDLSKDVDQTWLTTIDDYAKKRGEVAHKASGTHQPIDPKGELEIVEKLIDGFEALDTVISGLSS